jgi:hypothetical protein
MSDNFFKEVYKNENKTQIENTNLYKIALSEDKWVLVNERGKRINNKIYSWIAPRIIPNTNFIRVTHKDNPYKLGYLDKNGNEIIEPIYLDIEESQNYYWVTNDSILWNPIEKKTLKKIDNIVINSSIFRENNKINFGKHFEKYYFEDKLDEYLQSNLDDEIEILNNFRE